MIILNHRKFTKRNICKSPNQRTNQINERTKSTNELNQRTNTERMIQTKRTVDEPPSTQYHQCVLALSTRSIFVLDHRTLHIKQRIQIDNIHLSISPFIDDFLVIHLHSVSGYPGLRSVGDFFFINNSNSGLRSISIRYYPIKYISIFNKIFNNIFNGQCSEQLKASEVH